MSKIGPKVLADLNHKIGELLNTYKKEIDTAYLHSDSGLSIGISIKIEPCGELLAIQAQISFVESRIKNSIDWKISEDQPRLI